MLGAYERGERAISVPRLQRLARFYNVPVDQLLPGDEGPGFEDSRISSSASPDASVTIDLRKLGDEEQHRFGSGHGSRQVDARRSPQDLSHDAALQAHRRQGRFL